MGLKADKITDLNTGLEIYRDGGDFYFDETELEPLIRALPGGDGRWNALLKIKQNTDHLSGGRISAHIVQKWLQNI